MIRAIADWYRGFPDWVLAFLLVAGIINGVGEIVGTIVGWWR